MKSIECIDCDVIQDLLPSYCDGVTSELSNKLVEGHLKKCKKCKNILEEMNKQISLDYEKHQEERISFLKKYKKKMVKAILITIMVILLIINILINVFYVLLNKCEFFVDVNDIHIYNDDIRVRKADNKILEYHFNIYHEKYILLYDEYEEIDSLGNKTIYAKYTGRFNYGEKTRTVYQIEVTDDLERVYFEDSKGNKREIWNKYEGVKVEGRHFENVTL